MTPVREDARVFVVIPAFNEAGSIATVASTVLAHYPNVVVVDDGSTDGMAQELRALPVHLVRHAVNRGQGAALQTGLLYALRRGAGIIVTFDADGQHAVEDIASLIAPLRTGEADIALGSRFLGSASDIPWSRVVVLQLGVWFTRIVSRIAVTDVHNGLRAFTAEAAGAMHITMDRMAHASELLDQIQASGLRYREVPVTIRYTPYSMAKGQSSWNAARIALQIMLEKFGL